MNIMHTMASEACTTQVPKRRYYSPELKLQVVGACAQSGVSIAGVALQHGINANIVHRWLREHIQSTPINRPQTFVPVTLSAATESASTQPTADIRIEVKRAVLGALEQALYDRQPERDGALTHHSDRGSQYVSIRYTEWLAEAGIEPSVGSKGDSYDNALAEAINGLYKAEVIHRRAWPNRETVELAALEWVAWFNHQRLLGPIGYIPPAEAEANYYRQLASQAAMVVA